MRSNPTVLAGIVVFLFSPFLAGQGEIASHPDQLLFPPLEYEPPHASQHRHVLSNGVVGFFVENHDLPLVNVSLVIRAGSHLDPDDKRGLTQAVLSLLRSGGTQRWTAEEFDEETDFLAASISTTAGLNSCDADLNVLTKDLDKGLDLFFEMLKNPVFQQDRLDLYKSQVLQNLERRNDRTSSIERREWARLMRGSNHPSSAQTTTATIESISVANLKSFHEKYFRPANFIFAVSGDFDTAEMKARLESRMQGWQGGERAPRIEPPDHTPVPGVYLVNKEDVNQGRVSIGHLGIELGNPDQFAIDLMNDILGGSGFTSRILGRVRSDEGLAYNAGSSFSAGAYYPGTFRAGFESKSRTCAQAAQIILDEIQKIRTEKVSQEELKTIKNQAVEVFPRFFSSALAVAGTFATDELVGRAPDYWTRYRDWLKAVTVEDVLRVARQYLHPDRMVILAVGQVEDMLKGNPDRPEYSFQKLAADGKITMIPLPDPATMVYPDQ